MNEGFTNFMERKIAETFYSEDLAKLEAEVGYHELLSAINDFGESHRYTQLDSKLGDEDPDDAFSTVPYEKGFNLVYYLESIIGKDAFRTVLRAYIRKYAFQSITWNDFYSTMTFELEKLGKLQTIEKVNFKDCIHAPGHLVIKNNFHTKLGDQIDALVNDFLTNKVDLEQAKATFTKWENPAKLVFLRKFIQFISKVDDKIYQNLKKCFKLQENFLNAEVRFTWIELAVGMKDEEIVKISFEFLGTHGRYKYIKPVMKALYGFKREETLKWFEENKWIYHIMCSRNVGNVLKQLEEKREKK